MGIEPGVMKSDASPEETTTDALKRARAKIRELTTERDRIDRRLDGALELLDKERQHYKHAMYIICDRCAERITVHCRTTPPPNTHAMSLLAVADVMGWKLSAATLGVIAVSSNTPTRATVHSSDLCPACHTKETK